MHRDDHRISFKKLQGSMFSQQLHPWLLPITGLFALLWFLIRVIPKPSRASYPCQRLAFPLASSFILWIVGLGSSFALFQRIWGFLKRRRYGVVFTIALLCIGISGISFMSCAGRTAGPPLGTPHTPNEPIGSAKGIYPGRVVWVHDPDATHWEGADDGFWWEPHHTNQEAVDQMLADAVVSLTGKENMAAAWQTIFQYFNRTHNRGDNGYQAGEKIIIKVNFVDNIAVWGNEANFKNGYYPNTSPQMIHALLRHLTAYAGIRQSDITVGDTLCNFGDEFYRILSQDFPDVVYLSYTSRAGRTKAKGSTEPVYWSSPNAEGTEPDYAPQAYVDAEYLINLANLKGHYDQAGVTLTAKNHFGSLVRRPDGVAGQFNIHADMPFSYPESGHYRPLVDLMGHQHIGGKTLLYLIDGLYAGKHMDQWVPLKWQTAPFNDDWTSSLFASLDPVAIDSVGFDFLYAEWPESPGPGTAGADDYLHEAALADNPPSDIFYDPNHQGDVARLSSLGAHEHWNNSDERAYSRNLGTGTGIELIALRR
jgi:hypothetical protein